MKRNSMSNELIDELEFIADTLDEGEEGEDTATLRTAINSLRADTKLTKLQEFAIGTELINMSDTDWCQQTAVKRAINLLAQSIGLLEVFDPRAVCTSRMPTTTIDGIKYEAIL